METMLNQWLPPIVLGYLLGTIPTAYWLAKYVYRLNIFEHGSKNMGATNIFRVLGAAPFAFVLAIDIAKGYAGAALPRLLAIGPASPYVAMLVGGLAAIVGHTLSFWVGFRGGKGVATGLGVFLALAPRASLLAFGLFALLLWLTNYVSVGSCVSACALPVLLWLTKEGGDAHALMVGVAVVLALFIVVKHRANIQRLRRGEELPFFSRHGLGNKPKSARVRKARD